MISSFKGQLVLWFVTVVTVVAVVTVVDVGTVVTVVRVSMGLTDRRKTAKNSADSRKN